jgi:putative ABC transport system permease protein
MTAAGIDRFVGSRLLPVDVLRVGSVGLRMRRLRAGLSALGVAIGIAAMVGVLGISESSKADLLAQLDDHGTNLLSVKAGQSFLGDAATLDAGAAAMVGRIGPVEEVSSTGTVTAAVYRTDRVPESQTSGIAVRTADTKLLSALGATMRSGRFLDAASANLPVVVLGSVAAQRLGIHASVVDGRQLQVWLGDRWFAVAGILEPVALAPDLDRSALVGEGIAGAALEWDGTPATLYVRSDPDAVVAVRSVLARSAKPSNPEEVEVSRPSDAIAAKAAAKGAFTALFLGLGGVALLVGGVGIANVMVVSVLERRGEIGLRRALGATRRHVAVQSLVEALLLSAVGGAAGVGLGALATAGYARTQGWPAVVPLLAVGGGLLLALVIGAVAGLYPAARAARLAPSDALRG